MKEALASGQHDRCGVRAGKFSEAMLRAVQHELSGTHTPLGQGIKNFQAECSKVEKLPASAGDDSLRVMIPRALGFVFTLRNKRDFGHLEGDVSANEIDSAAVARVCDWALAELLRVVHGIAIEDAQVLIDQIAERRLPAVWAVGGKKRVLRTGLSYGEKVLLLLYSEAEYAVASEDLLDWTEHSNKSVFRRDVLRKLHANREIEYDEGNEMVIISPLGVERVETKVLKPQPSAT